MNLKLCAELADRGRKHILKICITTRENEILSMIKNGGHRQHKIKCHQILKHYISIDRKFDLEQLSLLCRGVKILIS